MGIYEASIYNGSTIYNDGNGGGGGSEGSDGIGSVNIPDGYKRLVYIENDKINNIYRTTFEGINIDKDCEIICCLKFPKFVIDSPESFFLLFDDYLNHKLELSFRDWTAYLGPSVLDEGYFFNYPNVFYGSTLINISDKIVNMNLNKNGLYVDGQKVISINGPFLDDVLDKFYFPSQIGNDQISSSIDIYKFSIKKQNEFIIDTLPCIEIGSNKTGLFDFVNNVFWETENSIPGPLFPY